MSYDAVLFDLDGTLADTLTDLANAGNHALRSLGLEEYPASEYRRLVGGGVKVLAQRALGPERAHHAEALIAAFRDYYAEHAYDCTTLYDGVAPLLDGLVARGVPMAVVSNKPHDFTRAMVAELLDRWPFAAVVGHRADVPPKPDPQGPLEVAAGLGVAPERCLFVGDTRTDVETARNAGMLPVGVTWGFRPREELVAHGAKVLLDHPSELLAVLDGAVAPR